MADKDDPDDPQYDWLYAGGTDADDSEPTRQIPVAGAPEGTDATRVLPVQPRQPPAAPSPGSPTGPPAGSPQLPQPGPQAAPPPSFGGTYADPSPRPTTAQPRYATPSPQQRPGGYDPPRTPPPQAAGATPARNRRRRHWWARGLVLLVLLWLVFLVAVPIWTWKHISKVDADPSGDRPADTGGTTYLLVGSDSREGLTPEERADLGTGSASGQRTDTIILLHVPDNDGPTLVLSIPRDSYVPIPGHDDNKINAAYAFGGPELLVQTIEQATDVRIDDYIEVGFAGFVQIVDAVGGITVCPQTAIDDPKAGNLTMRKGCQEVDGHTALDYSRSRAFPKGDITRAFHQREVISAVGSKAASWQTVVLPWRYLKVNSAAADTLRVGEEVGPLDLARFAWAMAHSGGSDAKRCVVPYSSLGTSTSAGSAVIWDEQKADALFAAIRDDETADISCSAQ